MATTKPWTSKDEWKNLALRVIAENERLTAVKDAAQRHCNEFHYDDDVAEVERTLIPLEEALATVDKGDRMMNSLIKRLRRAHDTWAKLGKTSDYGEAADAIERLTAALKWISGAKHMTAATGDEATKAINHDHMITYADEALAALSEHGIRHVTTGDVRKELEIEDE